MANAVASMIWRRLDTPGHDACRLEGSKSGWQLEGAAVFSHEGVPAKLAYSVMCDLEWRTQEGRVHGWYGEKAVDIRVTRTPDGVWTLNAGVVSGMGECVDLDFGFTPATNLFQLRRLAPAQGQAMNVPVAWLDARMGTLEVLHQRYERRSDATYWYEAPRFGYAAVLEITPIGFIRRYPGLWEAES